jgi:hypothetical protein
MSTASEHRHLVGSGTCPARGLRESPGGKGAGRRLSSSQYRGRFFLACRHRIVTSSSCAPISANQLYLGEDNLGTNHAISTRYVLSSLWSRISGMCLRAEQFVGRARLRWLLLSHFSDVTPSTFRRRPYCMHTIKAPSERTRRLRPSRRPVFPMVDSRNSSLDGSHSDVCRPLHHGSSQVELLPRV